MDAATQTKPTSSDDVTDATASDVNSDGVTVLPVREDLATAVLTDEIGKLEIVFELGIDDDVHTEQDWQMYVAAMVNSRGREIPMVVAERTVVSDDGATVEAFPGRTADEIRDRIRRGYTLKK